MSETTPSFEKYCLTAGAFQKLCGTTRETLRYLDKHGVLVPVQKENGYHYYSHDQIGSFYLIKIFQDLGCSIPEIKEKLLSGSDETFYTFYRHQQEELIRQEAEIHQKINAMDRLIHLLPLIQAVDGQGVVVTPIARPIFFQVSPLLDPGDIRDGTAMRYHALAHSLSRYEQFPLGNILNAGSFLEGHNHISHVFTLCDAPKRGENAGNADRPRRSRKADTFCVANRILALVHKESQGPIDQAYDLIREYVRDNNLTLRSDLCVFSVVNAIDPAEQNRYMTFLFAAV